MCFSRLFSIMRQGSLRSRLVLLGTLLVSTNVVLAQRHNDADWVFETCTARDGSNGHCRPSSECHVATQIERLTNGCTNPNHTCCPSTPKRRRNVLSRLDALPECRSGYGYCVTKSECSVRALRLREDRCPSPFHVCCAKASVVVPAHSTTSKPSTTTAAEVSSVASATTISVLFDSLDSQTTTTKTDTVTYRQPVTEQYETDYSTLPNDFEHITERSVPEEEALPSIPDVASLRANFTFKGCGYRAKDGVVEQLVRNQLDRAEYGEIPWMVAIFRGRNDSKSSASSSPFRHCCNGALISERAVLTTAHCVSRCSSQVDQIWVRLGEWDLNSSIEPLQPDNFRVRKAYKHKDFSVHSLINNIAVLALVGEVQYGPTIQPVCLPEAQYTFSSSQETLLFTGWHATTRSLPQSSTGRNFLTLILLNHHDRNACEKEIRYIQQIPAFILHTSFVCANVQHEGWPCGGEAGAPVVAEVPESENRYYVHGLVSRAYNCQQNRYPTTMLTSVAFFRSWIKRTLSTIHND
ncbi:phenoloxidase-activating factor 2-like [Anopheles aquasalis]|uniref:phenoloxidase-activating factor 2-like n=1 Tax=Anopheles aquasalis TaxID=42839 RepID=UPI00215AA2DA|nr:phenoloxidase-activating factor 2-like [Anopheles aquasalis]